MDTPQKNKSLKAQLTEHLHNPSYLRFLVAASLVLLGYFAVYMPMSEDLNATSARLTQSRRRLELARNIEGLRTQHILFKDRLPQKSDAHEWVQYLIDGLRGFPVKILVLDSSAPQDFGPYKVVGMKMDLEGRFQDLHGFLQWLEGNERFFRVDAVTITPQRLTRGTLTMQVTLYGLMG